MYNRDDADARCSHGYQIYPRRRFSQDDRRYPLNLKTVLSVLIRLKFSVVICESTEATIIAVFGPISEVQNFYDFLVAVGFYLF